MGGELVQTCEHLVDGGGGFWRTRLDDGGSEDASPLFF